MPLLFALGIKRFSHDVAHINAKIPLWFNISEVVNKRQRRSSGSNTLTAKTV